MAEPSFGDWCLRKIDYWQKEMDSRSRAEEVSVCRGKIEKYRLALDRAKNGFHA